MLFVSTQLPLGTAPRVIISVPHDWLDVHDYRVSFTERPRGWTRRDMIAWRTVEIVAEELQRHGISVQVIRWLLPRRYCDVNRPAEGHETFDTGSDGSAFADESLRTGYDAYHRIIDAEITGSVSEHGKDSVLFFDWHSFNVPTDSPVAHSDVVIGTVGCEDESCSLLANHLRPFTIRCLILVFHLDTHS